MEPSHEHLLNLAAKIVSAHVGNHMTTPDALPGLIRDVYRTLAEVEPESGGLVARAVPAAAGSVALRQPRGPEHLTCQECGLTMKMLKRHLITVHGLTPEDYRAKWGLPPDHPMVTPEYARLRSTLAKQSGLGKRPDTKVTRRGRSSSRG